MSALELLKARLNENGLGTVLTKPPKPPSVGFVSDVSEPFAESPALPTSDIPLPTIEALRPFKLDAVQAEIDAGHCASDLDRTNNLCWQFMSADGLEFSEALRIAASIVANCPPALGEQSYVNVRLWWQRMTRYAITPQGSDNFSEEQR